MSDRIARFTKMDGQWFVRADQDVLETALTAHGGRITVIRSGSEPVKMKIREIFWKQGRPYGILQVEATAKRKYKRTRK